MKPFNKLCLVATLFLLCTITSAWAEVKIGVIDYQKFQQKSAIFIKKKETFEKKFQPARQKYEQENQTLINLQKEFNKQKAVLNRDAATDKYLEIQAKARYVKFLQDDLNEAIKAANYEVSQDLDKDLHDIIYNFAKESGFTVVYEKGIPGLLYSDGAVDITDKIIEIYDKQSKP